MYDFIYSLIPGAVSGVVVRGLPAVPGISASLNLPNHPTLWSDLVHEVFELAGRRGRCFIVEVERYLDPAMDLCFLELSPTV